MTLSRTLLLALLLPLAGCQTFFTERAPASRPTERLQGEVQRVDGELQFRTCLGQRTLKLLDPAATGLADDALELMAGSDERLFADLRGTLDQPVPGADGQLTLSRVYRLQREGHGCNEESFKRLLLRASGNEPGWMLTVTTRGMLLARPDQPPVALPYLEERLPGGQLNLSSEANDLQLELWVAPQRCVDSASGTINHLTAELRLDGQTLRGCAHYGGARDD
ncbi:COG3650 family protein [Pseudomonas lopnurensis]|uniref:COG3650 family protein n=1 Tax=Pseudomonas lopnurensis TaxID=1477517 RepID=UPI0018797A19|nr:hypothetical protein [Pseudomonas lopnurensis]MBE7376709.1 hypothetical protein [Pseudomonas lopnurensis]